MLRNSTREREKAISLGYMAEYVRESDMHEVNGRCVLVITSRGGRWLQDRNR